MTGASTKHARLLLAVLIAALVAFGYATPSQSAEAGARPRLVLLLVVDGLPQRQVVDYRDQLAPDGFRRFLDRGTWFSDAHYGHSNTQTAPGHATMLTGAYPHRTGIIANEWRSRETFDTVYNTGDTAHSYIGHKTQPLDGTSPKNLLVETLGDVLRRSDPRSKVVGISGKDRGAILPAGHSGIAYIYMAQTGQFASTTYYMREHPKWVADFHAGKPGDRYFGQEWRPLLDDAAYAKSLPDEQKWYAKGGKLPKTLGEGMSAPSRAYYEAVLRSPFGDALTLDFARAALAGEALGRDDAPDILSISLSSHDYINHAYSAESRLSHDHLLHLDRLLQAFFRDLDAAIGNDNYVAVLTADHGFMPAPEHSRTLGHASGKQSGSAALARLNAALSQKFGEARWAFGISAVGFLLNEPLIEEKNVDRAAMNEEARRVLLAEPGIAAVYTRAELSSGSRAGAPHFDAIRRSWHPARSADLQYALKPYWMMTSSMSGTTHGSVHAYDTHVPMLFYGPRWIAARRTDQRVEIVDIAPTLARLLGVPAPSAAEGTVRPLR